MGKFRLLHTAHTVISEPQYIESRASPILALIKGKLCLRKGQRWSAQENNLFKKTPLMPKDGYLICFSKPQKPPKNTNKKL